MQSVPLVPVATFLDLRFVFFVDVAGTAGGLSGWGVAAVSAVFFRRRVGLGGVGVSPGCDSGFDSGFGGEGRVVASASSSRGFSKSPWRAKRVVASPALYSA